MAAVINQRREVTGDGWAGGWGRGADVGRLLAGECGSGDKAGCVRHEGSGGEEDAAASVAGELRDSGGRGSSAVRGRLGHLLRGKGGRRAESVEGKLGTEVRVTAAGCGEDNDERQRWSGVRG